VVISLIQHKLQERSYGAYSVLFKVIANNGFISVFNIKGKRSKAFFSD